MAKPRFKIDFYDYAERPFGLYFDDGSRWRSDWRRVDSYKTKEEALAFYAIIKDLPEYLP